MSEQLAIIAHSLHKSYGKVLAIHSLDLEVQKGEIFGFLGPNGAGKTTTIRCLLDLIRPDGGDLRVYGIDPQADPLRVRGLVGYLPGELQLYGNMTGEQVLRYFRHLRDDKVDWQFVCQLADRLDLNLKRRIKNLSKGNKQKIGVIQAFMHRPKLLLLDELTVGLDPIIQKEVHQLLSEAKEGGATVFFSSHNISEVQAIAERVGIIRNGQVVMVAKTVDLMKHSFNRVRVVFKEPVDYSALENVPGVSKVTQDSGSRVLFQIEGEMDSLIKALAEYPVCDFETERPSLEELFLAYYDKD